MSVKEKKKQRSFRLTEGTFERLEAIAKLEYRDMTNMVEVLIETAYAQAYGTDGEVKK
jgi:predicted DNA-binding protein